MRRLKTAAARLLVHGLTLAWILGLTFGLLRLVLPFADLFRAPLTQTLEGYLGLEVRMGGFRLRLAGMTPRITLEEVQLLDRDRGTPRLQLKRLHLDLDPAASLLALAPQIASLTLEGARLQVMRGADGAVILAGLEELSGGEPQGMDFFLAGGRLQLTDSTLVLRDGPQRGPITLTGVRLRFDNRGLRHRIGLRAQLAGVPESRIHLAADLHGAPAAPADWSGTLYLDWQGQHPPAFLHDRLPAGLRMHGEQLRARAWLEFGGGRPVRTLAWIELDGLDARRRHDPETTGRLRARRLAIGLRQMPETPGWDLALDGTAIELEWPWLFGRDRPRRFRHLAGPLRWTSLAEDHHRLASAGLALEHADFTARTRFALDWPPSPPGPSLDLYGEIRDLPASAIAHHLPVARLKPKLRAWMEQAFLAGEVPWASLHFQGRLGAFPFRAGEGRLAAAILARDLRLRFHPDWPPLEALDGLVRIDNTTLSIGVQGGRIQDFSLLDAQARIADLREEKILEVEGSARGAFDNGLRFLSETPLRRRLGGLSQGLRGSGTSRLDLALTIPLSPRDADSPERPDRRLALTGAVSWPGPATLGLTQAEELELSALRGLLRFDQTGILGSHLEAELWGRPLALDLSPEEVAGNVGSIRLSLAATTAVETLAQRYPHAWWRPLAGELSWTLQLPISDQTFASEIRPLPFELAADLRDLALDLPAPLGKHPGQTRPLRLQGVLDPSRQTRLQGRYGDLAFALELARNARGQTRLRRAGLAFGAAAARLPAERRVHLSGRLAELDLAAWSARFEPRPAASALALSAELRLERLPISGMVLHAVRLALEPGSETWTLRLEAEELAGRLTIPRDRSGPLDLDLDWLDLQTLLADRGRPATLAGDPRAGPAGTLKIRKLRWGQDPIGHLSLTARVRADGLAFEDIRLHADDSVMEITGDGYWQAESQGSHSRFTLAVRGEDLGVFLRHLGYASLFDKAPVEAHLHLAWPGTPADLDPAYLRGWVRSEIGAGRLRHVDPGVGRMLGVLNLNALQRRLSLDFRDLLGEGYAYERMVGELAIGDGRAEIVELRIESPAAQIGIEGTTDLVKKEFSQVVTVTPSLGTSAALAGAVAGGPLVGAAVFLVDKVSGGGIDRLGRHQYDITGPWKAPRITPREPAAESRPTGISRNPPEQSPEGAVPRPEAPPPEPPNVFLDPA